jgi:hypothetical protein
MESLHIVIETGEGGPVPEIVNYRGVRVASDDHDFLRQKARAYVLPYQDENEVEDRSGDLKTTQDT